MILNFTKMHATGNDFILVQKSDFDDPGILDVLARKLCRRHFSVGADGLLAMSKSEIADCRMDMFNPDGTTASCGNGIRCAAAFAIEKGMTAGPELSIESYGRIIPITRKGESFAADMGEPILDARDIPVAGHSGRVIRHPFNFDGEELEVTCVNMGNPHAVIFVEDLHYYDITQLGPLVENSRQYFPERINLMLVSVRDPGEIDLVIWERGAGETLSCGTGACASVVASVLCGYTDRKVRVNVPGGVLEIEYPQTGGVIMSGPANFVYEGRIEI